MRVWVQLVGDLLVLNAYNRSSGLGSVAMGFNTIAGPQVGAAGGIDGGNVGQFSAGWGSRAIGNISNCNWI
jgi:hypothetical protein